MKHLFASKETVEGEHCDFPNGWLDTEIPNGYDQEPRESGEHY